MTRRIDIAEAVGGGYADFWRFRGRYRVVKGSRASKKSKTAALFYIYNLRKYPLANLLVLRRTYASLERSCFAELRWAAERLGVSREFDFKLSPLEITRRRTGQKIFFRGMDDTLKLTSIVAPRGVLCWLWCEEAYEISSEDDFNTADELIRGRVPDGYFKQLTLTFNPWNERHWLKKRFFDAQPDMSPSMSPDIFTSTVTYMCNEFLDDADLRMFSEMKERRPARYRVAGLGEWGMTEGLVYDNFEVRDFISSEISSRPDAVSLFGLDFGYKNDPTALFCGILDRASHEIYVYDEMYLRGLTNDRIADELISRGYKKERIICDCAEPKSIDELRRMGIYRAVPSQKGADSILSGIDCVARNKIIINPSCRNFISEIRGYVWETDFTGAAKNRPRGCDDHLMDAMRYAVADAARGASFSF